MRMSPFSEQREDTPIMTRKKTEINFDEVVRNKWMSNDDTYRIFINIFNKMFASFSI